MSRTSVKKSGQSNRKTKRNNRLRAWTDHLKKWSNEHNVTYGQAMTDSKCRAAFKKGKGIKGGLGGEGDGNVDAIVEGGGSLLNETPKNNELLNETPKNDESLIVTPNNNDESLIDTQLTEGTKGGRKKSNKRRSVKKNKGRR